MPSGLRLLLIVAAIAPLAGCDGDNVTPVQPTPPVTVTDTFTGSINKNGGASHSFLTASAGSVTATLSALNPNPDLIVGFSVGTWNGTVCTAVAARDQAVRTTVIYGTVNAPGELCVRIYDTGNVAESTEYEITVVHP
jgi:pimeloyl-ACP methyl ester carboxylesterase